MHNNTINKQDINTEISSISHEIRNNLSICDIYSKILEKKLEKHFIKDEDIDNALACIKKSLQIINTNLFDLKSVNSGKQRVYDFKEIVKRAFELSKAYTCEKNITFNLEINNSKNIFVDEIRLISCIVNIIKNSIESINNKGYVSVKGDIIYHKAILTIENNGETIPFEEQKTIFDKGFTSKSNGNGLGLWICKKYLKEQNSEITLVQSKDNKTIFKISVPVYD